MVNKNIFYETKTKQKLMTDLSQQTLAEYLDILKGKVPMKRKEHYNRYENALNFFRSRQILVCTTRETLLEDLEILVSL